MTKRKELHVFIRGGLGNQLFQYSTGLAISEKSGKNLVIRGDLLPEHEDSIAGVSRWPNQIVSFKHSGQVRTVSFQPPGKTNLNGKAMQIMRLLGDGFPGLTKSLGWISGENSNQMPPKNSDSVRLINSYSPYKEIAWANRARLRSEINSIVEPTMGFLELLKELQSQPTIIVHLRQGDYLKLQHLFGKPSIAYLGSALDALSSSIPDARLWLFTDSPAETPSDLIGLLRPDRQIGPEELSRPIENLVLMSKGSALVAANSTFSWWASLLCDENAPVIAPRISGSLVSNFDSINEPNPKLEFVDV